MQLHTPSCICNLFIYQPLGRLIYKNLAHGQNSEGKCVCVCTVMNDKLMLNNKQYRQIFYQLLKIIINESMNI